PVLGEHGQVLGRDVLGCRDDGHGGTDLGTDMPIPLGDLRRGREAHEPSAETSSRAAASSESRPSSSPLSFRRRSSASTSPTLGDSASPSSASSAPPISSSTPRSRVK